MARGGWISAALHQRCCGDSMCLPADFGTCARLGELHGNNICIGGAYKVRRKPKTNYEPEASN